MLNWLPIKILKHGSTATKMRLTGLVALSKKSSSIILNAPLQKPVIMNRKYNAVTKPLLKLTNFLFLLVLLEIRKKKEE